MGACLSAPSGYLAFMRSEFESFPYAARPATGLLPATYQEAGCAHDAPVWHAALQVLMQTVMDLLTAQCDRHGENIFITADGQLTFIDNDRCVGAAGSALRLRSPGYEAAGSCIVMQP